MKGYIRDREKQDTISRWTGVGLTVAVHAIVIAVFYFFAGFDYVWPPPPEKVMITFEDLEDFPEPEKVKPTRRGDAESQHVDPDQPIEEVRASESPLVAQTKNDAPATRPTPNGDVNIPDTPETPLDPKALFPGHSQKDTTNHSQTSSESSDKLSGGQPDGSQNGALDGQPNAWVEGRAVTYTPKISGTKNKRGKVVIDIWIDRTGKVIEAKQNVKLSETMDQDLIRIALDAAKKFTFKPNPNDVERKYGTVTCVFELRK